MYLVDNNVLSHLSPAQRASRFFSERCRVPSEVIHEAGGPAEAALPKEVEYPVTVRLLDVLREIMSTVIPGDMSLVDLYANKGSADPLLIACALDATRDDERFLVRPTWVIVSDDKAVRRKASDFTIETRTREQFMDEARKEWAP